MKYFNKDFKTKLTSIIEEIEASSEVEIVVIAKPFSEGYRDIPYIVAVILTLIVLTIFIFVDIEFGDYLIYTGTVTSFPLGVLLGFYLKPLLRGFINKKRIERNVEVMARALFQKGNLSNTKQKVAVLFYCSVFERKVFILPDKKAELNIPVEEWEKIKLAFNTVFNSTNPAEKLLEELKKCKNTFSSFLPPVENDINEIPDNLEIIL